MHFLGWVTIHDTHHHMEVFKKNFVVGIFSVWIFGLLQLNHKIYLINLFGDINVYLYKHCPIYDWLAPWKNGIYILLMKITLWSLLLKKEGDIVF